MGTILYFGTTTQIHSGASQWMFRLAKHAADTGHRSIAILPSRNGIARWYEGTEIITRYSRSVPVHRGSLMELLRTGVAILGSTPPLLRLIRQEEVDVIHVNDIKYISGLLAGWLSHAKTVCHVRACFEHPQIRKWFAAIASVCADRIICVSKRTAELMFEQTGFDKNVLTVPDGVPSPERFDEIPDGSRFRQEHNISSDDMLVASVSKLVHNKGQDRLLDVADRLANEAISFVIVGGPVEGHEQYARQIQRGGELRDNVRVVGFQEDIVEPLGAADVLSHLPRHEDPFPSVVLEGMLARLPVVGSESGGIPEQIVDSKTGYIVPKKGGTGFIAGRLRTLNDNIELRRTMGINGRQHALEHFSTDCYMNRIDELYDSII